MAHGDQSPSDLISKPPHALNENRRISKAATACQTCRLKKVRCSEATPKCGFCTKHGFRCDYKTKPISPQQNLVHILRRLNTVERSIEELVALAKEVNHQDQPKIEKGQSPSPSLGTSATSISAALQKDRLLHVSRTPVSKVEVSNSLMASVRGFVEHILPLYPIICDEVAVSAAMQVVEHGFQLNITTCLVLLLAAIYRSYDSTEEDGGTDEFHLATQIYCQLRRDMSLEFSQAEILQAIYFYQNGLVMDAWHHIHTGCTTLYVAIQRDIKEHIVRDQTHKNTTLRLFWICLYFERAFQAEFPDLPLTSLTRLEDLLPLPLGCEESATRRMQTTTREIYTFFLAEMSLRAIWSRVSNAPANELLKADEKCLDYRLSPMGDELESQLKRWYQEIPGFLSWSIEPGEGRISKIGARLKLLYWFTVFSIYRPLVEYVASRAKRCLSLNSWVLLQAALQAGLNLARVVTTEDSERDLILYTWLSSALITMEKLYAVGLSTGQEGMLLRAKARLAKLP